MRGTVVRVHTDKLCSLRFVAMPAIPSGSPSICRRWKERSLRLSQVSEAIREELPRPQPITHSWLATSYRLFAQHGVDVGNTTGDVAFKNS
jgi:hypothetical protein